MSRGSREKKGQWGIKEEELTGRGTTAFFPRQPSQPNVDHRSKNRLEKNVARKASSMGNLGTGGKKREERWARREEERQYIRLASASQPDTKTILKPSIHRKCLEWWGDSREKKRC